MSPPALRSNSVFSRGDSELVSAPVGSRVVLDSNRACGASPSSVRDDVDQFRLLSTIARCLIHGIMARSFAPTSSIGCAAFFARIDLNEVWLTRFSSIQSLTNFPD